MIEPGIKISPVRTSVFLANTRFLRENVADCFYLDFSALRYPDKFAKDKKTKKILEAKHFPIILSTNISCLESPLPRAHLVEV